MGTLKYRNLYISHESDVYHEICKVYTDAELTNEIYDFVMLDVNGGCPYPVDIDGAIKKRIDKWLDSKTDIIKIDLDAWESASCPIYTGNITKDDLEKAERELYDIMCHYYRWNSDDVNRLLKGIGDSSEIDDFKDAVCAEEETLVMNYGGVYYEDMPDDEYAAILESDDEDYCRVITLVETIQSKSEEVTELFLELSKLITNKGTFRNKLADIEKYKKYLEEIKDFAI